MADTNNLNKSNYECKRKEVFERFQEQPGQLPKLFFMCFTFVSLLQAYYCGFYGSTEFFNQFITSYLHKELALNEINYLSFVNLSDHILDGLDKYKYWIFMQLFSFNIVVFFISTLLVVAFRIVRVFYLRGQIREALKEIENEEV